jgi:hypothetical protein
MRFKTFWHNDFRVAGRQQLADFATLPTFSFDGFDGAFPPKPDILFSPKQPRNWHEGELALTRLTWNQRNHKA